MTKERELQILQNTVEALGEDSYMGPWLKDNLPGMESAMRSDIPFLSFGETQAWAKKYREDADRYYESKVADAKKRAEEIIHEAERRANHKREYLRSQLKTILNEL